MARRTGASVTGSGQPKGSVLAFFWSPSALAGAAFLGIFVIVLFFTNQAEADVDLEPVNFTFTPDYPVQGESLEVYFEVINHGTLPAENVKIVVWNGTSECDSNDECEAIFDTTEAIIGDEIILTSEIRDLLI